MLNENIIWFVFAFNMSTQSIATSHNLRVQVLNGPANFSNTLRPLKMGKTHVCMWTLCIKSCVHVLGKYLNARYKNYFIFILLFKIYDIGVPFIKEYLAIYWTLILVYNKLHMGPFLQLVSILLFSDIGNREVLSQCFGFLSFFYFCGYRILQYSWKDIYCLKETFLIA